jgi:hypothetical protein
MVIYTPVVPLMTIISKQFTGSFFIWRREVCGIATIQGEKDKKLGRIGFWVKHTHKRIILRA